MKKDYYYLFGKSVCDIFINSGCLDSIKEEINYNGGQVYHHSIDDDPAFLLTESMGWGEFVEIGREQYEQLK